MMRTLSHSPGAASIARAMQLAGSVEEQILVTPDEIDLQQLELQVAPARLAIDRDLHQVGSLIVQAVRHVEVGFGERILLIEANRGFAAERVVAGLRCERCCRPVPARVPSALHCDEP